MLFLTYVFVVGFFVAAANGQSTNANKALAPPALSKSQTQFIPYKGISIGMPAADVRSQLGKPRDQSDAEDDYKFSDDESARVFYDSDKNVRVISVMFTGDLKDAPGAKSVVGTDITAKPDGGMHKMVQYPEAGYWISYVRTAGDDAMVIITIQKMAKSSS